MSEFLYRWHLGNAGEFLLPALVDFIFINIPLLSYRQSTGTHSTQQLNLLVKVFVYFIEFSEKYLFDSCTQITLSVFCILLENCQCRKSL